MKDNRFNKTEKNFRNNNESKSKKNFGNKESKDYGKKLYVKMHFPFLETVRVPLTISKKAYKAYVRLDDQKKSCIHSLFNRVIYTDFSLFATIDSVNYDLHDEEDLQVFFGQMAKKVNEYSGLWSQHLEKYINEIKR